jgi:hypothetical protein
MAEETRETTEERSQELTEQQVEERLKEAVKKKRGAPFGNQNARTHGFYSKSLTASERKHYGETILIEGLDEEIAVLRIKLKSLVRREPDNIALITRAANSLSRLINARNRLAPKGEGSEKRAILSVLNEIAIPAGISVADFLKK